MSGASVDRFRAARDRGCAFLLHKFRTDGGFGCADRGIADYYKVPLALSVCGESAAANRLMHWIRRKGMLDSGDFAPRPREASGYYYLYYNAWIIVGAARQGHFDLAQRGINFLQGFRDPETGGFYSSPTERAASTLQDVWTVCGAGQAALYAGRHEIAVGVGHWLRRLLDQQPEFPMKMYCVCNRAEGLLTRFPAEDEIRYLLDVRAARSQYFFQPGIAAAFLVLLYRSTADSSWLDLAQVFMQPAERACEFLFSTPQAGKVGWAAALLWRHTGDPKYRRIAERVGDHLIAVQTPQGCWNPDEAVSNDFTAEFVVWLDELYQNLGE